MVLPSIQMSRPRLEVLEHSAWYVGIVDVFMPFPTPVITRPTQNWARGTCPEIDVTWMITPMIIMVAPSMMEYLRPSQSPQARMKSAPPRHPSRVSVQL